MKKKGLKTDLDVLRSLEEGGIVTGDVRGRFFEGHVQRLLESGKEHVQSRETTAPAKKVRSHWIVISLETE